MAEIIRRCRPLLGTFVEVAAEREEVIEAAFAAVGRVHRLMSAHEPDSELSRVSRFAAAEAVEISDETRKVLERALYWSRASGGAFDIVRAGAQSLVDDRIPRHVGQPVPQAANSSALSLSGSFVRLRAPATLDVGGIAKGFAVDEAIAAMRSLGALRGLINAGGDLFAFGPESWSITVVDPRTRRPVVEVPLRNEALATSAGLPTGGGLSFAHLTAIQPGWVSVTVRAPAAMDADALTKIVWALGHDASDLLTTIGADAFAIQRDGAVEALGRRAVAA